MKYTHCIWDFNGTVLDDMTAGIRAVNDLLIERGLTPISDIEQYRKVFGFPIKNYYERLGFDFSKEPYDVIAHKWVALYLEYVKESRLCDGVEALMQVLSERGIEQVLLSATEQNMLNSQVKALGLEKQFSEVLGMDDIYAVSKLRRAREWRERNREAGAFFVGDTEHDCEAAEAMGIDCFLVAIGHQPKERLIQTGAKVFDSLYELCEYLTESELI